MSMHDIGLPPLPVPRTKTDGGIDLFAEYSVREYARAAIEADRKRRGEPVAWICVAKTWDGEPVVVIAKPHQEGAKPVYLAPQPAEPARVPSDDERAAQGLPPYSPRHLTEEEWNRLTENGRRAWGNHPAEPAEVSSVFPNKKTFTVEPHGNGYAIYQGRDQFHHGLNLAHLTECTPEFSKRIESALNAMHEPEGWKLVPVEPTREMLDAYVAQDGRFHSARADWATMLASAPKFGEEE